MEVTCKEQNRTEDDDGDDDVDDAADDDDADADDAAADGDDGMLLMILRCTMRRMTQITRMMMIPNVPWQATVLHGYHNHSSPYLPQKATGYCLAPRKLACLQLVF